MSDMETEEVAVEETNKQEHDDSASQQRPRSGFLEAEIIEGKREKKTVQRLDLQMGKPREKVKIQSIGHGDKLGDIARVNHAVGKLKAPLLKPLHKILYDRPGTASSLRRNIRLFNGFPFEVDSEPFNKKKEKVLKLPKVQLRTICQVLDLERGGSQAALVENIMNFLSNPTNSGRPVIQKKKRKKKTVKDSKQEKKRSASKKSPELESGKSKAIVTDSSSEEDEDTASNKQQVDHTDSEEEAGDKEEEEEEEDSDEGVEEDEETTKPKSKKPSAKRKLTPKKPSRRKEEVSEDDEDVTPKKKKAAAQKKGATPRAKKADSSSSRKRKMSSVSKSKMRTESSDDDDDEPLINLIKKPPTNEELKTTIKDLLKDINLEEVTMKQICQQVYDMYPDFDLTARKDAIKDTVKSLLS